MMKNILLLSLLLLFSLVGVTHADVMPDSLPSDKDSLRTIAFYYLNLGNEEMAKKYGRCLLERGEQENDRDFCELYGHLVLGCSGTNSGWDSECYRHLEMARTLAERSHNHEALVSVFNGFGVYNLFVNNDTYTAISYYFQALEEAKLVNDRRRYAIILANLSGAYFIRDDLSGLKFAEEAIEIARQDHEVIPLYYGLQNAAFYYLMTDSLERAEASIREVKRIHDANGFSDLSDIYLLKALLCEKRGDVKGAFRDYAYAMENFNTASPSTIAMVYLKYAGLLRSHQYTTSSIKVLEEGLYLTDISKTPVHKAQLLKELSLSFRAAGQYVEALDCAYEYQTYQDSLFRETRERALQEARIKHDIFSREQQISEQQVIILNNRYKITLLVFILVALLLALGLVWYNYKKKDRLYGAIVSQNREYMQREQLLMEQIEKLRQPGAVAASSCLSSGKRDDLMSQFTAMMIERKLFTDPALTVGTVADALGTNRTYLSKAINESTGKTFTQVVNDYRIREAIAAISDFAANKPLKQISTDVGFSSLSTFYATFQSLTGMTPARYRSKLKEI